MTLMIVNHIAIYGISSHIVSRTILCHVRHVHKLKSPLSFRIDIIGLKDFRLAGIVTLWLQLIKPFKTFSSIYLATVPLTIGFIAYPIRIDITSTVYLAYL